MTYCLALRVKEGLVFATDSRTTAGVDHINTYRKMHVFQPAADRFFVVLTSGNLATTQEVLDNLHRDLASPEATESFRTATWLFEAARYLGHVLCDVEQSHEAAMKGSGANGNATLILGGQIAGQPPGLYLVYPEGNYVSATEETPFLQLGEFKYGKPILSRIASAALSLDDAARLALISFDAAMKSNLSVGPPLELAIYPNDQLKFSRHLRLGQDSRFFLDFSRRWNARMQAAFRQLPRFEWESK